jgi:hypothetical protein
MIALHCWPASVFLCILCGLDVLITAMKRDVGDFYKSLSG